MKVVGGLTAGLDIWELAYLPSLLNNSESWIDIEDTTIKKLDILQISMYKTILNCPGSTLHAAMLWELGGIKMKFRIMEKKLNFLHHILNLNKSSLASQILFIQQNLKLPGLLSECQNFITELKLTNILEVKIKRNKWKNEVKNKILKANENELKDEIIKSKKLRESGILSEGFGIKKYIREMTLYESRTLFKHRCKATQYVKMNFRNDKNFAKKLWKCDHCQNIDTESHLLWCQYYKKLREDKDLNQNKDLCKYLSDILALRTKEDKQMKKLHTTQ